MAIESVSDWSLTPTSNTDIGGISLAENVMRPPAVNDAFREIMAQVAGKERLTFVTVAALLADTAISYTSGKAKVTAGDIVAAQGFRYEVAASGASDQHVTTAGGVKLYVLGTPLPLAAFGVGLGGDDAPRILKALTWADGRLIDAVGVPVSITSAHTFSGAVNIKADPQTPWILGAGGSVVWGADPAALPARSAAIAAGRSAVSFASAHGLAAHDVIVTHNPTDNSLSAYRANYQDGCIFEVDQVSSSTAVTVYGVSPHTFASAGFNMWKLVGEGVTLDGVRFKPDGTAASPCVHIWGHKKVSLKRTSVDRGSVYSGLEVWRSYELHIDEQYGDAISSDAYPIVVANCQKVNGRHLYTTSARHSIAWGGRTGAASVPVRDAIVSDSILFNRPANGVGAGEAHGNCINLKYLNCIMNSGANMAGENITLESSTVYGRDPDVFADGCCVYGSELRRGVFSIIDCTLITWGNGESTGIINFDVSNREGNLTIRVINCVLENKSGSSLIRAVMLNTEATASTNPYRLDIEIDGLTIPENQPLFAVLSLTGTKDISALASVAIDGVKAATGTRFVVATNSSNYNIPMRLQTQSGVSVVSCNSGSNIAIASPTTLRYTYPRLPHGWVGFSSTDGNSKDLYGGQRITGTGMYSLSATLARPEAHAAANFTSTESIRLSWQVGVYDF